MNFEKLFNEWELDSNIDKSELADESLKIPKLHHKYYTFLITEKSILKRLESDMKVLKTEKYEFYTQGHTEESKAKGWALPARGLILKADVPMYMESDKEIIDLSLKIGMQQEKIEFLESVIRTIQNRSYSIRNAIDFIKFTMGG